MLAAWRGRRGAAAGRAGTKPRRRRTSRRSASNPSLLLAFLARDAEGRRSAQSPVGRDLRRELPALGGRRRPVLRDGDDDDRRRRRATPAPGGRRPPTVLQNATLFNQAIDAMSMRHWDPSLERPRSFLRDASASSASRRRARTGDMLAEVASRAAAEHVSYLELMLTPDGGDRRGARHRGRLGSGPRQAARQAARRRVPRRRRRAPRGPGSTRPRRGSASCSKCGTPQADPGCLRHDPLHLPGRRAPARREAVFAPDAGRLRDRHARIRASSASTWCSRRTIRSAVRDFSLQMSMLDFLHAQYPAREDHAARRRADRRAGAAGDAALPHPRVDPHRTRVAHRPRRRRDVRGRSARRCCARWRRRRCWSRSR